MLVCYRYYISTYVFYGVLIGILWELYRYGYFVGISRSIIGIFCTTPIKYRWREGVGGVGEGDGGHRGRDDAGGGRGRG